MVWEGISAHSRSDLVVIDGNLTSQQCIDEVLRPVVVHFLLQHQCQFQDDNARPHRARILATEQHGANRLVSTLTRHILGRRFRSRTPRPRTLHELAAALRKVEAYTTAADHKGCSKYATALSGCVCRLRGTRTSLEEGHTHIIRGIEFFEHFSLSDKVCGYFCGFLR